MRLSRRQRGEQVGSGQGLSAITSSREGAADEAGLWARLPRAELAATAVLGGVGLAIDVQLGAFTWALGLLLGLNQMRAEAAAAKRLAQIDKLAEIFDLSERCNVEHLRNVIDAYAKVPEPEFQRLKDEIVAKAKDELDRLGSQKSSRELYSGEYYRWLLPMIDAASAGSSIRALSLMMSCEWDDSPSERRFIQANIDAATRGVAVERIFVMPAHQLKAALEIPSVASHVSGVHPDCLRGYFVDLELLQRTDMRLAERLGDGFICFGKRVALIDMHSVDGSARGFVTMLAAQLDELRQLHAELLLHSVELSRDLVPRTEDSA